MSTDNPLLDAAGLQCYQDLRAAAIDAVTERFYATHGSVYAQFGARGRAACREDLGFHLEFLRPVLEFGLLQPMVDYLHWLASILATRDLPAEHLPLSLEWLADFFGAHMAATDGQIVVGALQRARARFEQGATPPPAVDMLMPPPWPECEAFEHALLAGDRRAATALFDGRLDAGHSLVEAELHMIQPALYGVGRKWQNNQASVAQEHLATAISQALMTYGLMKSPLRAANGKRVLLACVEGNQHALGLQMVSDAFQLAGWEAQFLGANVPTRALMQQIAQFRPDLLALSVSFAQQLQVVKQIVAQLIEVHGPARPAVIVGGLALNQFRPLVATLGADAWSPDAGAAVAAADRFMARPEGP